MDPLVGVDDAFAPDGVEIGEWLFRDSSQGGFFRGLQFLKRDRAKRWTLRSTHEQCFDKRRSSGNSNVLPAVALNFENLVAKVFPIAISSAAMVKEKGRLSWIGIFELDEQFSTLNSLRALCALFYFGHCCSLLEDLRHPFATLLRPLRAL